MNTIFDKSTRDALIQRINSLNGNSKAQWGKMNVVQMVKHCTRWEEMIHYNKTYKRPFIGILLGKIMLKKELKDDSPMRQNNPTIPELIVRDVEGDIVSEKMKWISLVKEYEHYAQPDFSFVHPFFGKMTREQIGYHAYKHTDHHLRQFHSQIECVADIDRVLSISSLFGRVFVKLFRQSPQYKIEKILLFQRKLIY